MGAPYVKPYDLSMYSGSLAVRNFMSASLVG